MRAFVRQHQLLFTGLVARLKIRWNDDVRTENADEHGSAGTIAATDAAFIRHQRSLRSQERALTDGQANEHCDSARKPDAKQRLQQPPAR